MEFLNLKVKQQNDRGFTKRTEKEALIFETVPKAEIEIAREWVLQCQKVVGILEDLPTHKKVFEKVKVD